MTQNLQAIYENGAFHPTGEVVLPLANGAKVQITVESSPVDAALTADKPFPTFSPPADARPITDEDVRRAGEDFP